MKSHPVIFVSGALANKPWNGGEAWVRLSWILGLRRLGYDVWFVEQIAPKTCVDRCGVPASFGASTNRAYFRSVTRAFGLSESAALICGDGEACEGVSRERLLAAADQAVLLVNISGHLDWQPLFEKFRCKAYIDIDPGFTQYWHTQGNSGARLGGHDLFFTIAENMGREDCLVPSCGLTWEVVRQPLVLAAWRACHARAVPTPSLRFTTVASWRGSFGPITIGGRTFGPKAHEFRRVLALPRRAPGKSFEIALAIHPADHRDLDLLREHGWKIVDPSAIAACPDAFRNYVQSSDAEFSVAQGVYVDMRSGWISDRTIRYLASARPAVVQDTGQSSNYACDEGLVTFTDIDGAAEATARVARDYAGHARAALLLAEREFDSDNVLSKFLQRCGQLHEAVTA